MNMLDKVSARLGMTAPPPRLRVVREDETAPAAPTRTARPEALAEFIGQQSVVYNLSVECVAAEMDQRLPDHILLEGPAGLGKTSLARCVAARLGVRFVEIPATALGKVDEVASQLARIGEADEGPCVVFVDEVHGVCKRGQLLLLSALEDGFIQPSGAARIELAPFCMIGATTNPGQLSRPLRERFGVREALDYYEEAELERIVARYAELQDVKLQDGVAYLVAAVGRGTPRVAIALMGRIAKFARVGGCDSISGDDALDALGRLGVDDYGLEPVDRKILEALTGQTGALGLPTLAARLGVDVDAITTREPYLMRVGALVVLAGRGRALTRNGYKMLGKTAPVWTPA